MIYYDLKKEAENKSIGNVACRENEIKRIARTLKRQYNNNVLLRAENGIGKSALLEGFAYQASKGQIPGCEKYSFSKLESSDLKKYFSQITHQETNNFIASAFKNLPEQSIIFIDDFQNAVDEHKFIELNQIFSPFFERNDTSLVLAISEQGYRQLFEIDPGFFQHFEEIQLKEN